MIEISESYLMTKRKEKKTEIFSYKCGYCGIFSSPELKAQVSFSDRLLSVVCLSVCLSVRPSDVCLLDFYIFNFFFRTTGPIFTKVGTNHP
jgi:hypothetical protein